MKFTQHNLSGNLTSPSPQRPAQNVNIIHYSNFDPGALLLSDQSAIVELELHVISHDEVVVLKRLCDEHSIKRIPVMKRQILQQHGGAGIKRQHLEACFTSYFHWVEVDSQLPEGRLDHDFGYADGTYKDDV